jgi:hypothetical protein
MAAQLLHRPGRKGVVDVVRHLLGVQAQVLSAGGLAVGARAEGLTAAKVDRARTEDRSIVHTWAMRGTLHLIAAEDFGWLRRLVLEPGIANARRRVRQLGLDSDPDRAVRAVERMLGRHGPLTRREIVERLHRSGYRTADERIAYHLVWLSAATGGVCYGPSPGGDRCFVLVRDWIGESKPIDREAALAELAVRYLKGHGPSTPEDLAFWAGLRLGDARRAWSLVGDRLRSVQGPAGPLWFVGRAPTPVPTRAVGLLPNFDEYLLGWKDRSFVATPARWRRINRGGGWLYPVVLIDGKAAGLWRSERTPDTLGIIVEPFESLGWAVRGRLAAEAKRVGAFVGLTAEVSFG